MGLYRSQYIGPVLLAKQEPKEEKTFFVGCSKRRCRVYGKAGEVAGAFCHHCGSTNKDFEGKLKIVMEPSYDKIRDALDDAGLDEDVLVLNEFVCVPDGYKNYIVYMPNDYLGTKPPNQFDSDESTFSLLIGGRYTRSPEKEIQWFKDTYQSYIKKFSELYVDVQVEWGVFAFMS